MEFITIFAKSKNQQRENKLLQYKINQYLLMSMKLQHLKEETTKKSQQLNIQQTKLQKQKKKLQIILIQMQNSLIKSLNKLLILHQLERKLILLLCNSCKKRTSLINKQLKRKKELWMKMLKFQVLKKFINIIIINFYSAIIIV